MTALVLRIASADNRRVRTVPIAAGQLSEAVVWRDRLSAEPSVRSGLRRVEIVPAGRPATTRED
ncbi:hypothetical protein [Micromonospora carbonacea]|uniref:hypothetical protein n=1 Tax=Micromonospora carbonacea TaxID=47853 RepID=UPI0037223B81